MMGMGCCGGGLFGGQRGGNRMQWSDGKDLEAILKERLARGEITADEYERIRAILAEGQVQVAAPARPRQMAGG